MAQIDLRFVSLLVTFTTVLGEIKYLSNILQSPQLNLGTAVTLVDSLVDTLESYREGSVFNDIWDNTLTEQSNISATPPGRQVRPCIRHEGHYLFTPIVQRQVNTKKESFWTGSFIPVIDVVLSEVKRRFLKENCVTMKGIQTLNPCSATFCEKDIVFPFASQYNCSTDDLQYEIPQFKHILERKQSTGQEILKALIELTAFLEPYKGFHQMFKLCKIALTSPVSTASSKRSFSKLKLIKTALRSTMTNERLSNLGVLSVELRRAKAINLDDFVNI